MNGKVFTSTTPWKPKNLKILFQKSSKFELWLLTKSWNHLFEMVWYLFDGIFFLRWCGTATAVVLCTRIRWGGSRSLRTGEARSPLLVATSLNASFVAFFVWLWCSLFTGERDKAVGLLLDEDSKHPEYYTACLRACLVAATQHSAQSSSTIKLVATNLIAAGKVEEGQCVVACASAGLG